MNQQQITRIARLLYYYALSTQRRVVRFSPRLVSKIALISQEEAVTYVYKFASLMGKGAKCKIRNDVIEVHIDTSPSSDVNRVFEHWVIRHRKNRTTTKLTTKRRSKIQARLKEGYTVAQLKRGVDGILESDFHVENEYTDITVICGDATKLDRFIGLARRRPRTRRSGNTILDHMSEITS